MLVIIGESGSGKSTTAARMANGRPVISAGGWVREALRKHEHSATAADEMARWAEKQRRVDPDVAIRWIAQRLFTASLSSEDYDPRNVVLEGVRHPRDLLCLTSPGDHVLDLGGSGVEPIEIAGLAACRTMEPCLVSQGVTWSRETRTFALLPEPLDVVLERSWLYNRDRDYCGFEPGRITALESYHRQPVTAVFTHKGGGTFHDLPLQAFRVRDVGALFDGLAPDTQCYGVADVGPPVVELGPGAGGLVSIYGREGRQIGVGRRLLCMHWPQGNTLLWLVSAGGRLLLWPPHKLLDGDTGGPLPDWRKLRQ